MKEPAQSNGLLWLAIAAAFGVGKLVAFPILLWAYNRKLDELHPVEGVTPAMEALRLAIEHQKIPPIIGAAVALFVAGGVASDEKMTPVGRWFTVATIGSVAAAGVAFAGANWHWF